MFERDKAELRDLGVPLETGRNSAFDGTDGYRIARRDYELGDIDLEPDEAAAVALAVRLWEAPELTGAANGALLKLRAAGVDVDEVSAPTVEPKVRATEPAFAPLLAAVEAGQAVTFDYRRSPPSDVMTRTVEPWGVVSWRGRWYLVGQDRARNAPRCFRLTRIVGEVSTVGKPGGGRPAGRDQPDGASCWAASSSRGRPPRPACGSPAGRAHGVRRQATVVGPMTLDGQPGDEMTVELRFPESAAGWLAGHGQDVVVLEPEVLRKTVRERLLGVVDAQAKGEMVGRGR